MFERGFLRYPSNRSEINKFEIESVKNELLFRVGRMIYLATTLIISAIGFAVVFLKI